MRGPKGPHQRVGATRARDSNSRHQGAITKPLIGVATKVPNNGGITTLEKIVRPLKGIFLRIEAYHGRVQPTQRPSTPNKHNDDTLSFLSRPSIMDTEPQPLKTIYIICNTPIVKRPQTPGRQASATMAKHGHGSYLPLDPYNPQDFLAKIQQHLPCK
ncbi:hypothetical protein ACLOJK_039230 [Asimina triloba]